MTRAGRRRPGAPIGFALGAISGVLLIGLLRLAIEPPAPVVHYHANWAVVVNGQRLDRSGERFMEDVTACKTDPTLVLPEERVHLHNRDASAVHVHATGVTWGHLLANLEFGVGDDYLVTHTGERLQSGAGLAVKFILNGEPVPSIRNRGIARGDRLLISYGPEPAPEVVRTQFPLVASTAAALDRGTDPAGCGGAVPMPLGDRLRRAFRF